MSFNTNNNSPFYLSLIICWCFSALLQAQESSTFWIKGQVRPRLEWRNGYKTLQSDSAKSYAYIEQRTRLSIGYKNKLVTLFLQPQDVRVWGSTALVNNSNSFFTLFNGWAKINWAKHWSLKVGRQVWSYDNQRILGGLNWAAQGRAHDGLLLECKNDSSQLELQLGAAYNSASNLAGAYNLAGNYRTLQFLRLRKVIKAFDIRLLFMNIGQDGLNNTLNLEMTAGGMIDFKSKLFKARLEGYYQFGNWNTTAPKQAFLLATKWSYTPDKLSISLGGDWLSGTDEQQRGIRDNSFNPWLGTNHIFYGHLDYFYVGSSHGGVGLIDAYAEVFYTFSKTLKMGLMYHYFQAPNAFLAPNNGLLFSSAFLGHEIDFIGHFKPQEYLKISFGYAQLLGNTPLEILKPSGAVSNLNNWAWLMLDVNLELFRHHKTNANNIKLDHQRF